MSPSGTLFLKMSGIQIHSPGRLSCACPHKSNRNFQRGNCKGMQLGHTLKNMEKYDEKAVSVLARAFADNIKNVRFDYEGFIQKDNGDGTCQVIVNQQATT